MYLIFIGIISFVVGLVIGLCVNKDFKNEDRWEKHEAQFLENMRQRNRDYFNNPVVEQIKRDKK